MIINNKRNMIIENTKDSSHIKIIISIISGVLAFLFSKNYIIIDNIYNIKLIWSLIFPIMISIAWEHRYAYITAISGTIFIPFYVYPNKGYANILISVAYFILLILNGYFVKQDTSVSRKIVNNIYFVQIIYSIFYCLIISLLYTRILYYNPPIWNKDADRFISLSILRIQSINFIFNIAMLSSISNVLLNLPYVRKLFFLKPIKYTHKNINILIKAIGIFFIFIIIDTMVDTLYFSRRGIHSSLLRGSGGGPTKITIIITTIFIICDFTMKMKSKSEEAHLNLIRSEERYRLIFENMIDTYFEVNTEGSIIKVSPSVMYSFGYTQGYMEGKNFYDFFENSKEIKKIVEKIYATGRMMNIEVLGIKNNGELIYLLLAGDVSSNPESGEKIAVINARNITDYKTEEKIKLNLAANLEAVFESSKDFIWTIDGKTYKILSFNSAYRNFLRSMYSIEVKSGDSIEKIIPHNKVNFFKKIYRKVLIEGSFTVEYTEQNRMFELTLYPININDNKKNISIFARDITAQKEAELEIKSLNEGLEEMVEHRTKELLNAYNDLESFSYTVSHEFKTPIKEIEAYMTIIEEDCMEILPEISKADVLSVKKVCKETLDMVEKMMDYSKAGYMAINPEIIDIKQLVEECYNEVKVSYSDKTVVLEICDLPELFADKFLMKQAVFNIISNSIKFSRNDGEIIITVGYTEGVNDITYYFKDNGVGFDSEYSNNLFGLFNRLHNNNEFKGSGIGLATVKRIIERNGGQVRIWGEKDRGCIVFCKFKRKKQSALYI